MKKIFLLWVVVFLFQFSGISQIVSTDSLKKHVYTFANDSLEGRSIGTKGGNKAALYIVEQFKTMGIKPLLNDYYHHFVYKTGSLSAEGKNIIGIIEGSDPVLKNEYIIIGAHYDHVGYYFKNGKKIVYNGADDNASGVASVIELGRAIYQKRAQFSRSIILVAFDGEETGLNGSTWFVKDTIVPLSQIKLMLSIDMIGMLSKNKGLELYGVGSLKDADLLIEQVRSKTNLPIKKLANDVSNRTDTKPFADAGIPAIHFFTGTVSPYHKPADDADLLDYEGMTQITDFIYAFTAEVGKTDLPQLVSKLPTNGKPAIFKGGIRTNFGTGFQNYPNEFYQAKSGIAAQAGLYAHINLSKRFVFQPEVLYETLGCQNEDGNFRSHGVTTPLNMLIKLVGDQKSEASLYLLAGGYYTYHFAGQSGGAKIDFSDVYEKNESGVNLGIAFNVSKIQFGFNHKFGLTNLYKGSTNGNIKNDVWFFTAGLQF